MYMRKVNIHQAKTTLSKLVEAAEAGETIVLARAGKPVARIVRLEQAKGIRLGGLKGKLPRRLLEEAVEPMSPQDVSRLFNSSIEP